MKAYVVAYGAAWGYEAYLAAATSGRWRCANTEASLVELIRECAPRYVFFLNWSDLIRKDILDQVPCVNFHCTDLRKAQGRGGHPIENLIMAGHTHTVISAHQMTEELDAGPVYGVSDAISLEGTKAEIQQRFVAPVVKLIRFIVKNEPAPVPQQGTPTVFNRLKRLEYDAFWAARATHG